MAFDPFIIPVPSKLANDPELGPYFNFQRKVLADLTAVQPGVVDASAITSYTSHSSGAVAVTSESATDLDTTAAQVAKLTSEVKSLRLTVNNLLTAMRNYGAIGA